MVTTKWTTGQMDHKEQSFSSNYFFFFFLQILFQFNNLL